MKHKDKRDMDTSGQLNKDSKMNKSVQITTQTSMNFRQRPDNACFTACVILLQPDSHSEAAEI